MIKSIPWIRSAIAAVALSLSAAAPAALVAEYTFSGNLESSVGSAPDLVFVGTENGYIDCGAGQAFQIAEGAGLQLDTSGLIANDSYSVTVLFEFHSTHGYRKILDFKNRTEDGGLYIEDGALNLFPAASSGPVLNIDTFVQMVVTRDSAGNFVVYINGTEHINVAAGGLTAISGDNMLTFFLDDLTTFGEYSGGTVANISLYDSVLNAGQVAALTPTVFPTCAGAEPLDQQGIICNALTTTYDYGPWHEGELNRIKFEVGLEEQVSERQIRDFLFIADAVTRLYSDTFGWPLILPLYASNHWVQPDLSGAGTGGNGTCWSPGFIGLRAEEVGTDFGDDGQIAEISWYGTLVHELLHLWDFRGQLWLQGPDTGHSFTEAFEPWANAEFGLHYLYTHFSVFGALPPQQGLDWIEGLQIARYINEPLLDWDSYYSDEAYALSLAGNAPVPRDYERLAIQGAFVTRLMRLHGVAAMQGVWDLIEAYRLTDPDVSSLTPADVNRNFIRFIGDGLQLDISGYLDFWKFPVPADLRTHLAQYPPSPMLVDGDNDGIAPWFGDYDDIRNDIYPGADELLDGVDNNLNGMIDELVVTETGGDFPASTAITLPVAINGELSDLADVDSFTFTLAEPSLVSFQTQTIRGDVTAEINGRTYERLIGGLRLDGGFANEINDTFRGGSERTFAVEAGAHTLEVGAFNSNSNPGEYQVQVFINDYAPPPLANNSDTYDFKVYPNLKPNGAFDCATVNDVDTSQCEGLVNLYETYGVDWVDARGWLMTPDACYWRGVFCNNEGVSRLLLGNPRSMNGSPPNADDLPFPGLRQLRMSGNLSAQPLSDMFGHLTQLRQLSMGNSNLQGSLPASLGSLPDLTTIIANNNQFSGELPGTWSDATSLRYIDIRNNPNLSGPIPAAWAVLDLDSFYFDADRLCTTPVIAAWLAGIENVTPGSLPCGYLFGDGFE